MIISVSGFGYTGSGAVLDYLSEFHEMHVVKNFEMSFLTDPHGIADLENALVLNLTKHGSDASIKEFLKTIELYTEKTGLFRQHNYIFDNQLNNLAKNYIASLIDITWQGTWDYDILTMHKTKQLFRYRVLPKLLKLFGLEYKNKTSALMHYSNPGNEFYCKTKVFTTKLFSTICNLDVQHLVCDQLIPPINPVKYLNFINDCKCIIVDRDPRDIFLLNENVIKASFVPSHDIEKYVKWYRLLRNAAHKYSDNECVLRIKFEDLIYKYNEATDEICCFLGVKKENRNTKNFEPETSINNTQLKNIYLAQAEEVSIIEKELAEYLYCFPANARNEGAGKIF